MRAEAEAANHLRTKAELEQASGLMEAVCERGNLKLAYQRVVENKGAAGVDGVEVAEFKDQLKQHWPTIKAKLLAGSYMPSPVRRVDIPKPQGGMRTLGIPTLTDRLIQQALHQVLSPIFEADFSESSYGFRPGRNAHQAVKAAKQYVAEGRRFVVDMDLEKFFDRVNHDLLIGRVYLGDYPSGARVFTFPMSRVYGFDHMTVDDHAALFLHAEIGGEFLRQGLHLDTEIGRALLLARRFLALTRIVVRRTHRALAKLIVVIASRNNRSAALSFSEARWRAAGDLLMVRWLCSLLLILVS
jgi:hypothetical protein